MTIYELINGISSGTFDEQLGKLYGSSQDMLLRQRARYLCAAENFSSLYPERNDIHIFSVPAAAGICGDLTGRHNGCVLSAAVNSDIIALVAFHDDGRVQIRYDGFPPEKLNLDAPVDLSDKKAVYTEIIGGAASYFSGAGVEISGLDAYVSSDIPADCGFDISSVLAVLVTAMLDGQFSNGKSDAAEIARTAHLIEKEFCGCEKPVAIPLACSAGGFVFADLKNPDMPAVRPIEYDFSSSGYSLCITSTGESGADTSAENSAALSEMKHVAEVLGCDAPEFADEDEFYEKLPELRKVCTDHELLRAASFFKENSRAALMAEALENGDTEEFFRLVNESAASSINTQDLFSESCPEKTAAALADMLSRRFFSDISTISVYEGSPENCVLAFVPNYLANDYAEEMNRVFGENSCRIMSVRTIGIHELTI